MTTKVEKVKPVLQLTGEDGNAFAILGNAHRVARKAGWTNEEWTLVFNQATEGDYNDLLATMCKYFDVN